MDTAKFLIKNEQDFKDWKHWMQCDEDYLLSTGDESSPREYPCVVVACTDINVAELCFVYLNDFSND